MGIATISQFLERKLIDRDTVESTEVSPPNESDFHAIHCFSLIFVFSFFFFLASTIQSNFNLNSRVIAGGVFVEGDRYGVICVQDFVSTSFHRFLRERQW